MSKSRRSSIASGPCHLEWRPSPRIGAALWLLTVLAPFCLVASDLPGTLAWPLAVIAFVVGFRDAWRYRRQEPIRLLIPAGRGPPMCDAERMDALLVHWRGPLAFLRWRDREGRRQHCVFAADTLSPMGRRELKLVMQRREAAAGTPTVAG